MGTKRADKITGTKKNDVICGLGGNDVISGGGGNDVLDGGSGNDKLNGGVGNDVLIGGIGNDSLLGGVGTDTASYQNIKLTNRALVTFKTDLFDTSVDLSNLNPQDTNSSGLDTIGQTENLMGGDGDDTLTGDDADNAISGGVGDDDLFGEDGNDVLSGNVGADLLDGGAGLNPCHTDLEDTATLATCEDVTAPYLVSWTISPGTFNASLASQKITITAHVRDDLSGIAGRVTSIEGVGVTLRHAGTSGHSAGGGCAQTHWPCGGGIDMYHQDPLDMNMTIEITIPQFSAKGIWGMQMLLRDEVGNVRYLGYDSDASGYQFLDRIVNNNG
jgi:hypothetical protein